MQLERPPLKATEWEEYYVLAKAKGTRIFNIVMNKGQIHLKSNIFRVYQTCDVVLLQHNNITLLHQLVWDLLLVQGTSPKYVYLQNRSNLIWFWGISGSRPNWCIFHIYAIKYIQFSALWGRPATTLFGLEWLKSKQLANVIMRSISTKIQPLFCITSAPQKCLCYFWLWLEPEAT